MHGYFSHCDLVDMYALPKLQWTMYTDEFHGQFTYKKILLGLGKFALSSGLWPDIRIYINTKAYA
jgi:hypothetical protein